MKIKTIVKSDNVWLASIASNHTQAAFSRCRQTGKPFDHALLTNCCIYVSDCLCLTWMRPGPAQTTP